MKAVFFLINPLDIADIPRTTTRLLGSIKFTSLRALMIFKYFH